MGKAFKKFLVREENVWWTYERFFEDWAEGMKEEERDNLLEHGKQGLENHRPEIKMVV